MSPRLRTIALPDRTQEYAEYGNSGIPSTDTILMVHGLRGTWQGLDRIAKHLVGAGYRVIVPALPGFGAMPDLDDGDTVANYAIWLAEFTQALGLTGHVILGHSFGSIVVAAAADSSVRATVLVNPIAVPARQGPHPLASRGAELLYSLALAAPERVGNWMLRTRVHVRVMSVTMAKTKRPELRRWIHRQHDQYYGTYTSRSGVVEAFRESVERSVGEYAANLATPTLLIAGELDDIATPADEAKLAASIADSELHVIPGVGHLIHYEKPQEAVAIIDDYLRRHRG